MEEASGDSTQGCKDDEEKKKKNVFEEKSKEELILLVKKYFGLLQKSKRKTDELNAKCSLLEQERNAAVQEHQSTETELLNKIAELQQNISKLTFEKENLKAKDPEISELKKKLSEADGRKSHAALQRDYEEQLQCLNLQLQSLKASCQCIQEENTALKKLNEENSNQLKVLSHEKNALLSDVEKKIEQYNSLIFEKNNIKEKYDKLVEKNHSLLSETGKLASKSLQKKNSAYVDKIRELEKECQMLRTENIEIKERNENLNKENENYLIQLEDSNVSSVDEVQKLKEECQTLRFKIDEMKLENESLNKKLKLFEGSDSQFFIKNIEELQATIRELKGENKRLKSAVPEHTNIDSSKVKNKVEEISPKISKEISDLKSSKIELEEKVKALQAELEEYHSNNDMLKEELKKLRSLLEPNDYKAGIELALLQGATKDLLHCNERYSSHTKRILDEATENETHSYDIPECYGYTYSSEETSGLEYALLQGGNVSSFATNNNSVNEINSALIPGNDDREELLNRIEKFNQQVASLQENLQKYSSYYSESLEENESLRKELEKLKSKGDITLEQQDVNTVLDEPKSNETLKEFDLKETEKEISIPSEIHYEHETYIHICKEIYSLYEKFAPEESIKNEELSENKPVQILKKIENMHLDMIKNLEVITSELNDYNLQLELLVIGVKQGVRQKTPTATYQTENKLEENVSLLKEFVDDLVMRSNSHVSKIKNLESNFAMEKKKLEDELLQLKELNQFLEVENREFNNEVKKLKKILNDNKYYRENYQRSPELYSIDESSEIEEKPDIDENLITEVTLHQEDAVLCNYSTQTTLSTNDFSVQVELDWYSLSKNDKVCDFADAVIQTDEKVEDNMLLIEQLKEENQSLIKTINEKSVLVEQIHYQMDSLFTKVEELSVELQEKNDDLKHSQCLNADLKRMLTDAENIKKQQADALKVSQTLVGDFKVKNTQLNEDIKELHVSFKELITNVNNNIMNIVKQSCHSIDNLTEKCSHKENNLSTIRTWINESSNDFEVWFNFMNQIADKSSKESINIFENYDMSQIDKTAKTPLTQFSLFEVMCEEDACCLISKSIELLNSYKLKLFSAFYNHLNSNYIPVVKDMEHFKVTLIPKMEKNIAELEKKLSECTCQSNSKEEKILVDNLQTEDSAGVLKNQLIEAETKMNKFKQIALKLKKDLAQTKEQLNEVIAEKEKVQKQNSKLLDEFNKISDDQCKYAQNYQSLQIEFDKVQDDCEMYKDNIKKLEEGLTIKLNELTASKEQIIELESQLNLSKQLNGSNLSAKKELEAKYADLEGKIIVLESKIADKIEKINSLEGDVAKHLKDLNSAWEENKDLKNQLDVAQKEGKKKNLLDLEMADYERSITELNNQIQRKDAQIEELQNELKCIKEKYDTLQEEMKSTEALKETERKRAENFKEVIEKTKAELKKVQDHEAELLSKTASLQIQLETLTQQEEDHKLQMSEASVQIQRLQDVIKTSADNHQRIVKSFEQKVANQKQEILLAHKEVEAVKQEFENYKIRVHSVLKQQKTVMPAITTVDADLKEKLETMNEKLKLQVTDLSEKLTAVSLEYESLQEEHESLLQRYNKVIEDQQEKDKEWHQRLELVNAEKNRLRTTQEELSSQHLLQNEMLVATYKKQIKIMSEEHKHLVNDLQKQLDAADIEISRLQRDQQKLQGLPVAPLPQDNAAPFDIFSQERQEGEGSESTDETNTPIRHLSLATIPSSGFLSFEKLIQSPVEPGTPSSYMSTVDSEKLTADLSAANKKLDHLSELLNDSESTNLRLSEQVRVLKDEVRRLENNKERERHAENLEYLKNVFIKFSSLQPGSEKAMLIPVLTTMLKLSPSEQQQLKSVAGDLDTNDSLNSGWSSYLHRWSGLS